MPYDFKNVQVELTGKSRVFESCLVYPIYRVQFDADGLVKSLEPTGRAHVMYPPSKNVLIVSLLADQDESDADNPKYTHADREQENEA